MNFSGFIGYVAAGLGNSGIFIVLMIIAILITAKNKKGYIAGFVLYFLGAILTTLSLLGQAKQIWNYYNYAYEQYARLSLSYNTWIFVIVAAIGLFLLLRAKKKAENPNKGKTYISPGNAERTQKKTLEGEDPAEAIKKIFACKRCKTLFSICYVECPVCHGHNTIVKKELVPDAIEVLDLRDKQAANTKPVEKKIVASASTARFCRKCGSELIMGSAFCKKCGAAVINLGGENKDTQTAEGKVAKENTSKSAENTNRYGELTENKNQPEKETNHPNKNQELTIDLRDERISPKVKRAFLFLEDEEWEKADEYLEKVLDEDPTDAYAYVGKLMLEFKVSQFADLKSFSEILTEDKNYRKASRFADDKLASLLSELRKKESAAESNGEKDLPVEEKEKRLNEELVRRWEK